MFLLTENLDTLIRKFGEIDKKIKDLNWTENWGCGLEFGKEKVF